MAGSVVAKGKPKEIVIEAVVIRADGTREDLGKVAYWHKNPFKRYWMKVRHGIRGNQAA